MQIEIEGIRKCLQHCQPPVFLSFYLSPLPCLYRCSVVYFSSHFQEKAQGTYNFQREVGDGIESSYIKCLTRNAKVYSGNCRGKKLRIQGPDSQNILWFIWPIGFTVYVF